MQNNRIKKLKTFNLSMGFLHLIQAILMVWLSTDFTISLTSSYIMGPPGTELIGTEVLTDLRLGILVALFMFLSSIAHFSVSTCLWPEGTECCRRDKSGSGGINISRRTKFYWEHEQ